MSVDNGCSHMSLAPSEEKATWVMHVLTVIFIAKYALM